MERAPTTGSKVHDVLIEPASMDTFSKKLATLNKKAAEYGLEPVRILSCEPATFERVIEREGRDLERLVSRLVEVRPGTVPRNAVLLSRIRIKYPTIKLGHWTVVGKLEGMEGGNLAFAVTQDAADQDAMARYAGQPITCEHCGAQRQRNGSFVLREGAARAYRQVGSSCLKEYTGIDPAAVLFLARLYQAASLAEADLDGLAAAGRSNAVATLTFLANVVFLSRHLGFVSAAKSEQTGQKPTFELAVGLGQVLAGRPELATAYDEELAQNQQAAEVARQWFLAKDEDSAFDHNVKLLLQADAIATKRSCLAFAAAAIAVHGRAVALANERQNPSRHVGTPGERLTVMLTIDRVIPLDSRFGNGVVHLVLLRDRQGNKLAWKASACPEEIWRRGEGRSLEAAMRVKGHTFFRDVAQTSVTRLKVLRWLETTAAS